MLKELRPAVISFLLLTLLTGIAYPLLVTGISQTDHVRQGQRQPDHERRQAGRLQSHRPVVLRSQVFLGPSFGDRPDAQ